MIQRKIISAVEAYCEEGGYSQTSFGLAAVADGQFLPRLRVGRSNLKTVQRAVDYMAQNPLEGLSGAIEDDVCLCVCCEREAAA